MLTVLFLLSVPILAALVSFVGFILVHRGLLPPLPWGDKLPQMSESAIRAGMRKYMADMQRVDMDEWESRFVAAGGPPLPPPVIPEPGPSERMMDTFPLYYQKGREDAARGMPRQIAPSNPMSLGDAIRDNVQRGMNPGMLFSPYLQEAQRDYQQLMRQDPVKYGPGYRNLRELGRGAYGPCGMDAHIATLHSPDRHKCRRVDGLEYTVPMSY